MSTNKVEIQIKATDQASPVLGKVAVAMDKIDPAAKRAEAASDSSLDSMYRRGMKASEAAHSISKQLEAVQSQLLGLAGINIGAELVGDVAATADEFKNLEAKIRLAVGANGDVAGTMAEVKELALATYTSLDGTTQLFGRLAASAKELGISQQDALDITETINKSIQVSGASAQASQAAVQQLVQGLQSGVLRGDEFNSVMEQAPRLAKALADGLGKPVGALRAMAEEGKLTSAVVVRALQGQRQAIESEFTQLPLTIGRAVQNVRTEFTSFVGMLDSTTGASSLAAQGIQSLADHMDTLARVAGAAGAAMTASLAVSGVAALRAASTGASILTADLAKIPRVINIAIAAVGFETGFQIGEWLYKNYELARTLGIGLTEFATNLVSDLQFVAEAAAAIFTGDTVGAAFDRYAVRAKEMQANFAGMYEDAKNAPAPIAAAATQAAASATAMGEAGKAAGTKVAAAGVAAAEGLSKIKPAADSATSALLQLQEATKAKPEVSSGVQLGLDLKKAHEQGKNLSKFLETSLPAAIAKLSGPELERFKKDFQVAMQVAGNDSKALETGLRIIGERAAQSLGVDLVAAGNRAGAAFKASNKDLDALIAALPALKERGVDTGKAVGQALTGMINSAKNQAEIVALTKRIEELRSVLGSKVSDGLLDDLKLKAQEMGSGIETSANKASKAVRGIGDAAGDASNRFRKAGSEIIQTAEEIAVATAKAFNQGTVSQQQLDDAAKQNAENAKRYGRPGQYSTQKGNENNYDPGRNMYGRAGQDDQPRNGNGQTQAEFQRAERLAGQGASDETLRFTLAQKLQAGALTPEDLGDLRAVVQTLKNNEQIFKNITPGGNSLEALADDAKWRAIRQSMEQQIARFSGGSGGQAVGRPVNMTVNVGGKKFKGQMNSERDAQEIVRAFEHAASRT